MGPWIPDDFSALTAFQRRHDQRMDPVGTYMNSIEAAYDLAFMDQTTAIETRFWSLQQYDLSIGVVSSEARFAIWGLGSMCQTLNENGFFPSFTQLTWGGEPKGSLGIGRRETSSDFSPEDAPPTSNLTLVGDADGSSRFMTTDLAGNADFDVHTTYNGKRLTFNYVLQVCLSTISYTAQFGPSDPLTLFNVADAVMWVSGYDTNRRPLLKARHVWKTMRTIAKNSVKDGHFGEMDIELWIKGVKIGAARLKGNEDTRLVNEYLNLTIIDQ